MACSQIIWQSKYSVTKCYLSKKLGLFFYQRIFIDTLRYVKTDQIPGLGHHHDWCYCIWLLHCYALLIRLGIVVNEFSIKNFDSWETEPPLIQIQTLWMEPWASMVFGWPQSSCCSFQYQISMNLASINLSYIMLIQATLCSYQTSNFETIYLTPILNSTNINHT